jgi:ankyrin repeat protein
LELLLHYGGMDTSLTDAHGRNTLHFAARGGKMEAIHYLIIDTARDPAIHIVQRILEVNECLTFSTHLWSPLHWVCPDGDPEILW